MSIAGIRSNKGDGYQTLVAFDWALTVLTDQDFQWIEVDSVMCPVDDIVIGKTDGTQICCQCKKNQIHFKAWTIADLADELDKAASLLASNNNAFVRFYSRSSFGALAKLREYSTTQANEASYQVNLSKEHLATDTKLGTLLATQAPHISTYEFLRRTIFETSHELDRMEDLVHERLRFLVSNPKAAFDALWTRLDQLGSRMEVSNASASSQHRLTKDDLKKVLHQAGAMLAPAMDVTEVRASFASTSAIGRSWHRDIAGQSIERPELKELLEAIDAGHRAILLTGMPGSGKTCVMLALQEALEKRTQTSTDIVPLFIQSREFADLATEQERQAQGLPVQWVEKAARIADDAQVVVVIDSLDVLSIAREHSVLTYFLAQIDRLLLIPNITVITACRDFDRNYDRRITERQWDFECKCLPFDWESEIAPLLDTLGIDTTIIDAVTCDLIRNPRELALFVELAQREGSFNIVTSQALAQRYLDIIVRADGTLGETAMEAVESIAEEMLKTRRLAVPHQRFPASQDMQRVLCSLNVLQETQDGDLTFGHQTLLDVLVISGAVRRGVTLNEFIQGLPPVPFVRPSIRSFIAQLAMGERRRFRKQLRTVLTGSTAFHIRRLVAESLAEQKPQDDDWPLIRDLRDNHRDVFQVIYTQARLIEWHYFWLTYLVPVLKDTQDAEGMAAHAHLISQWKSEDAAGVLAFWAEILQLDWMDGGQIAWQLTHNLSKINNENLTLVSPLFERLLCMPRQEHSLLGHVVARCVAAGSMEDIWLWRYIAGDISDDDISEFHFGNKLHCQSHEFGNHYDNFLQQRMEQSTTLLDLALESIERWSRIKSARYGTIDIAYYSEFLSYTSWEKAHSQSDLRHMDSENILLDSMETAIHHHAKTHSDWWLANCERLCFSHEGALCYFGILACTTDPETNIDLIGRILRDKALLESELSFELGSLMHAAFMYLDTPSQDAIMETILTVREEDELDDRYRFPVLTERAKLIVTIPCHLRSPAAQATLDAYEKKAGRLIRQPEIMSRGGWVSAPFSFEVFHNTSDSGVLRLLAHYSGYKRDFDDFLIGGERQVVGQLREASSRHPTRFLNLLAKHWDDISECFRDDIMSGVANYLSYRYGNLQKNGKWEPLDEPDAHVLACQIIDELERHPKHWHINRAASSALQACAHVIKETENASRLVFLALSFVNLQEKSTIQGDSVDPITAGINMTGGHVVEALMILASQFQENGVPFPELLPPALLHFAGNEHPAIRALLLRRLPYLQSEIPELGWNIFHRAIHNGTGLWKTAERCLYYAYYNNFEKVAPLLDRIQNEGCREDMETWGRISALAALAGHIDISILLNDLKAMDSTEVWQGAASVWTHHENIKKQRDQCLAGIEEGLRADAPHAAAVVQKMGNLFHETNSVIPIPLELIQLYFAIVENNHERQHRDFYGFDKWLNATSQRDPEQALAAAEIYLAYINRSKSYLYDYDNSLTQLMTRLFAEAEEREDSDHGVMLQRVVFTQDMLLSLGVEGIKDWLTAAERP